MRFSQLHRLVKPAAAARAHTRESSTAANPSGTGSSDPAGWSAAVPTQQLRKLRLRLYRRVLWPQSGEHRALALGSGLEFDELRPYEWGEDTRYIDWNVTARTGEVYLRRYQEEREVSLLVVVDSSPSMQFGAPHSLWSQAARSAWLLAQHARLHGNRMGLLRFDHELRQVIRPGRGHTHWQAVLQALRQVEHPAPPSQTSLNEALARAASLLPRRGVLVVVSDFLAYGYLETLGALAQRHDIRLLRLEPDDRLFADLRGIVPARGSETGQSGWAVQLRAGAPPAWRQTYRDVGQRLAAWSAEHQVPLAVGFAPEQELSQLQSLLVGGLIPLPRS